MANAVGGGTNALLAFSLAVSPACLGEGVSDWAAPSSTLAGAARAGTGRSEGALGAEDSGRAGTGERAAGKGAPASPGFSPRRGRSAVPQTWVMQPPRGPAPAPRSPRGSIHPRLSGRGGCAAGPRSPLGRGRAGVSPAGMRRSPWGGRDGGMGRGFAAVQEQVGDADPDPDRALGQLRAGSPERDRERGALFGLL